MFRGYTVPEKGKKEEQLTVQQSGRSGCLMIQAVGCREFTPHHTDIAKLVALLLKLRAGLLSFHCGQFNK
jgi:hypothetical protein